MTGKIYLTIALVTAAIGLVVAFIGPLANRWHKKLEEDLQRLKKGDHRHT